MDALTSPQNISRQYRQNITSDALTGMQPRLRKPAFGNRAKLLERSLTLPSVMSSLDPVDEDTAVCSPGSSWDQRRSALLRSLEGGRSPKQVKRIQRRQRRQTLPHTKASNSRWECAQHDEATELAPPTSTSRWESSPRKCQNCSHQMIRPTRTGVRSERLTPAEANTEPPRLPRRMGSVKTAESPRLPTRVGSFNGKDSTRPSLAARSPFQTPVMPSMPNEDGQRSCTEGLENLKMKVRA